MNKAKIPNSPLPANKLRQYIGPSLTKSAQAMTNGTISEPLAESNGYSLLYMINNDKGQILAFEQVEKLVADEYRRRRGDEILPSYLQQLREQADVTVDEHFLNSLDTQQEKE